MSYLSWTCWMYHCIVLTSRTEAVSPSSQSNTCCCCCLVWFVCVFFFFFAKLIATLPFVLSFKFPMYTSSFGRCCGVSLSLCFYVRQLVCIMLVFLFFNFLSVLVRPRPNVEPLQWIPSTVPEVRTAVQNFIILFGGTCRCERVDTCFTVSLFEEYSLLWALVASLPSPKLSGNLNGVFSIS